MQSESTISRISHRAKGGPDLNYLYASINPYEDEIPTFVHPNKSINRKKKGRNKLKRPVQRGRKTDKRTLRGTTLYLGGEEGPNNKIYCIPGHAERVLCIDTKTDEVYPVGPEFDASNMVQNGKFKWLRGIVIGDIIYGLPCHADCILRIDCRTDEVTVIDIPYEKYFDTSIPEGGDETQSEAYQERHSPWKYHGGTISPHDNCIYAVPQYSKKVLRINPVTEECSFVGPNFEGRCKWYGGVIGNTDGAIYCIPQNAEGVLRIDASGVNYNGEVDHDSNGFIPSSPEARVLVTTHGDYPLGLHKWHGAAASADGTIVSVPNNADNVLCIKPAPSAMYPTPDTKSETTPEPEIYILEGQSPGDVATGRHRDDGKYKYLGAMAGNDGHVYCFPSGSERVLQVNTVKRIARSVGPNLRDSGMEPLFQNKWQNGLTNVKEECVYAIPLGAETVLRIKTNSPDDDTEPDVTTWLLPTPNKTLEKWEGGVVADNGIIYCMPNNHKAVLQIVPPYIPSREELHKANEKKREEWEQETELEKQQQQKEMEEKKAKKEQKRQERLQQKKRAEEGEKNQKNNNQGHDSKDNEVIEEKKEDETSISTKEKKPTLPNTTPDGIPFKYKTGIATLRSSSHRVKVSTYRQLTIFFVHHLTYIHFIHSIHWVIEQKTTLNLLIYQMNYVKNTV